MQSGRILICLIILVPGMIPAGTVAGTRQVVVGIYDNAPLAAYRSNGQAEGIFPDILAYIAEKEAWHLKYRSGTFSECLSRLDSGSIDLMVAVAYVPERTERYRFNTEAVISNWAQLYRREGAGIRGLVDLNGKRLGVVRGDIYYEKLKRVDDTLNIRPVYIEVSSYQDVFDALDAKSVDAGVVSRTYGRHHDDRYRVFKTPINFGHVELHFAAPLNTNRDLIEAIDRHLVQLKNQKHSVYYRSIDLWLEGVRKLVFPGWLRPIWVIAIIGAVLLTLTGGTMILRWQVKTRTEALRETLAAGERIESELRIAHDIQMELLPMEFPPFPGRKEFDLYADIVSAREVGGDFYDYFMLDNNHLCFLIGDVSDKGVPAALFMAKAKTLIKAYAGSTREPDEILEKANRELFTESFMFVTCFCGVVNISDGNLCYTCAGHNPPLLIRQDGSASFLADTDDAALGIEPDWQFKTARITLGPGDDLLMYTDGITEAYDHQTRMFTENRLKKVAQQCHQQPLKDLVDGVRSAVEIFADGAPQRDDITILGLRFFGPDGRRVKSVLTLRNRFSEIERLAEAVIALGEAFGLDDEMVGEIRLALEEVVTNIIKHGYGDEGDHEIEVRFNASRDSVAFTIIDDAPPYNPLDRAKPGLDKDFDERDGGGLGICLMQRLMDDVEYRREGTRNLLVMTKRIPAIGKDRI